MNRRWIGFWGVAIGLVSAACGSGTDVTEPGVTTTGLAGFEVPGRVPLDADLSVAPEGQLSFWNMGGELREDVYAPLYQGAFAGLGVTPDRLAECGASPTVTASVVPDVGSAFEVPLTRQDEYSAWSGRFLVPESARQLTLWIRAEDGAGCVTFDSDGGQNYVFPVHRWTPSLVHFRTDWSEVQDAPIYRGGVIAIDYALERLPDCRIVYRGFQSWDIIAHARIDGVEVPGHSVVLTNPGSGLGDGMPREPSLAFFAIPWQTQTIELWFENNEYPPLCQTWDSDFGANYRFTTVDAGTTPPGARLVFAPGWEQHATGPIFAGADVTIAASPERFPTCGTSGSVKAGVLLSSGELLEVALDGSEAGGVRVGTFRLPLGVDGLEVWLYASTAAGCNEYDSHFGENYPFPVQIW